MTTLPPPTPHPPSFSDLPLARTDAGLLIGPVLIGESETQTLRRVLLDGGSAALMGYNGLVRVHADAQHRRIQIEAQAERLLTNRCGPTWYHQHSALHAARIFVRAIDTAPSGEVSSPSRVRGNQMRLHLGHRTVHLPDNLTGRYRTLIADLRGNARIDSRWYGQFEVSTRQGCALVETEHGNVLTDRLELADALEAALPDARQDKGGAT